MGTELLQGTELVHSNYGSGQPREVAMLLRERERESKDARGGGAE